EGPPGGTTVGLSLFLAHPLPIPAPGPLADMREVLQAKERVRVSVHNASADAMVAILLQPSLSPAHHDQPPCCGASAFALQPFPQPGIVVCYDLDLLTCKERRTVLCIRRHCQISLARIHSNDTAVALWRWVWCLHLQTYQQVELLARFVIPQLGGSNP